MTQRIQHYNVFGADDASGNTAAVLPQDDRDDQAMRQVAASVSAVTTVFVAPASDAAAAVRFFTATSELSLCFHGLLAASAWVLDERGADAVALRIGDRRFRVQRQDRVHYVEAGEYREAPSPLAEADALALLGLDVDDRGDGPLCVASIGSPKLLVSVADPRRLAAARPNLAAMADASKMHSFNGVYAYAAASAADPVQIDARGFNPLHGVDEDPATGVAAGALGAALSRRGRLRGGCEISQGTALGQRNRIYVAVGDTVRVGGTVRNSEVAR